MVSRRRIYASAHSCRRKSVVGRRHACIHAGKKLYAYRNLTAVFIMIIAVFIMIVVRSVQLFYAQTKFVHG